MASNDPNVTSGRANAADEHLRFPLTENLSNGTMLRFVEYDRLTPNAVAGEKTTKSIFLPIPMGVPDRAAIRTSHHDLGILGNITGDTISKAIGSLASVQDLTGQQVYEVGKSFLTDQLKHQVLDLPQQGLRGIALNPLVPDGIQRNAQAFAGVVNNPHTTMLFDGVNLKTFNLQWRLSPRSLRESETLLEIINTIKERMHPEEILSGFALNYPDLVYVEFLGDVKKWLPKFQKAFISDVTITQGSALGFYKSGAPIEHEIQLSFCEINIVTRNTLQKQNA